MEEEGGGGSEGDIPPSSPGGRYAAFFKSGQRPGILPEFTSSISRVIYVLSLLYPPPPRITLSNLSDTEKNLKSSDTLLGGLLFLLSFALESFSPGGESEGEPPGEDFALKLMQMR